jgi:competence protein ComFC
VHQRNRKSEQICIWCLKHLYHDATLFDLFLKRSTLCASCKQILAPKNIKFSLGKMSCRAIVEYDESIEKLIYRYKEDKDLPLAVLFFNQSIKYCKQANRINVLIPSSKEKVESRGFHHLQAMFDCHKLPYESCLIKNSNWKQSSQSKENRAKVSEILELRNIDRIKNKRVLLIDDVATTGSTLLSAYKLLVPHASHVSALVFAVHPKLYLQSKML